MKRRFLRLLVAAAAAGALSCSGSTPSGPGPIPSPLDPILVGAGDIGVCGSAAAEATGKLLDGIPGTVFAAGDIAYFSGTAGQFRDCYDPVWGRHRGRTRPAPGNHEYESPGAAPYFQYFGPNAGPPGRGYYSYDLGAWHVVSLNSNVATDARSPQGQWLRADLESNRNLCTAAYWHHPRFSSGPNGDHPHMRDFWRILYEFDVDLVISAHDHLYERFAPQDPDGRPEPARGIRQFVAGTGGAPLYAFGRTRPNSEARSAVWGVLKVTLHATSYEWEFLTATEVSPAFPDAGGGRCH